MKKLYTLLMTISIAITAVKGQTTENIWWANQAGINRFDVATKKIGQPYKFTESYSYSFLGDRVSDFAYHPTTGNYYCTSKAGGSNSAGTLTVFNPTTKLFTKLVDFGGADKGISPAALTWGKDGRLYGITTEGGTKGGGTFFKYDITSGVFVKLFDLAKPSNGWVTLNINNFGQTSSGLFYVLNSVILGDPGSYLILNPVNKTQKEYAISATSYLTENADKLYYFSPTSDGDGSALIELTPGVGSKTLSQFPSSQYSSLGDIAIVNNTVISSTTDASTDITKIFEYNLATNKLKFTRIIDDVAYGLTADGASLVGVTGNNTIIKYNVATSSATSLRILPFDFSSIKLSTVKINKAGKIVLLTGYGVLWIEGTPSQHDDLLNGFVPERDSNNKTVYVDGNGDGPESIVQAYNGKFYGVTTSGGNDDQGILFEFDPVSNTYKKKLDLNNNSFSSLITSFDGRTVYGKSKRDSLLTALSIGTLQVSNVFNFAHPTSRRDVDTYNITGLTAAKTSTNEKLCWVTNFSISSKPFSQRWVLETYEPVSGAHQAYNPLQLYSNENIYVTDASNPVKSKLVDSLYREKLGVNPKLTISNGKIYLTSQKQKKTYETVIGEDGLPYVNEGSQVTGTNLIAFDLSTNSFSVITNFNNFKDAPTLVGLNSNLYANITGDPDAAPSQLRPGLYQVNLTQKQLAVKWAYDSLTHYPFGQPVAGNGSLWSGATDGRSCLINYNPTTNAKVANFFTGDFFSGTTNLLWLPASPVVNTASSITSSGFTVSWAAIGGATNGYAVEISTSSDFATRVVGYDGKVVTATSLAITGLQPATAYYVRVSALAEETRSLPSASVTATTLKVDQTITWGTIPTQTVGSTLALNAMASSNLAVTYTTASAAKLSISGSQAALNQAGQASITANQAGNVAYNAAAPITQTFCINPVAPTITVTGNNTASPSLRSSASAGNQWYLNGTALATATLQTLSVSVSGTYTVTVAVEGCASAPSANQVVTVVVNKLEPTITWANPATIVYGTALSSTQLNATANVAGTFAYSPALGTILNAGNSQTLSVLFTPTDQTTYKAVQKSVTLSVSKAVPTLQWGKPANVPVGTVLGSTQLNALANGVSGASLNGTFSYLPASGTVLTQAGPVALMVTFTPSDGTNYNLATKGVTLQVDKLTPTVTWLTPAAIPYGTPLSDTQLNATASINGSFSYTPAKGTVLNVGTQTLNATFIPTDAANYATATGSTELEVTKASQSINFTAIAPKTLGDEDFALQATASSGLPVVFEYPSNKISLTNNNVKLLSAGFVTLVAKQAGNGNYEPADQVSKSFCIAPAKPTITLSNSGSDKVTLTSSALVGNQWYVNETLITGATGTMLAVTTPGVYKVQATVDVCSSAFSDNQTVVVTGDVQSNMEGVHLFPNPVEAELTVRFPSEGKTTTVTMYDVTGRLLASQTVQASEAQFSVGSYSVGLYLVRVQRAQGVITARFEKK